MELEDKLLIQQLRGRLAEAEAWIGLFVVMLGRETPTGYKFRMSVDHADDLRSLMPRGEVVIEFGYEMDDGTYTIDAI